MSERDDRTEGLIATAVLLAAGSGLLLVAGLSKVVRGLAANEGGGAQLSSAPAGVATFGAICLLLLAWALVGPRTPRWRAPRYWPACGVAVLVLPLVGAHVGALTLYVIPASAAALVLAHTVARGRRAAELVKRDELEQRHARVQ